MNNNTWPLFEIGGVYKTHSTHLCMAMSVGWNRIPLPKSCIVSCIERDNESKLWYKFLYDNKICMIPHNSFECVLNDSRMKTGFIICKKTRMPKNILRTM